MRTPTPREQLYAFHTAALRGEKPMITHAPECGWYTRRLVKGGPIVPARIWVEQETDDAGELVGDEVMKCEVAGKERDPIEQWTYIADAPISEAQFHFLTADAAWLRANKPDAPEANPSKPVIPTAIPRLF